MFSESHKELEEFKETVEMGLHGQSSYPFMPARGRCAVANTTQKATRLSDKQYVDTICFLGALGRLERAFCPVVAQPVLAHLRTVDRENGIKACH